MVYYIRILDDFKIELTKVEKKTELKNDIFPEMERQSRDFPFRESLECVNDFHPKIPNANNKEHYFIQTRCLMWAEGGGALSYPILEKY